MTSCNFPYCLMFLFLMFITFYNNIILCPSISYLPALLNDQASFWQQMFPQMAPKTLRVSCLLHVPRSTKLACPAGPKGYLLLVHRISTHLPFGRFQVRFPAREIYFIKLSSAYLDGTLGSILQLDIAVARWLQISPAA